MELKPELTDDNALSSKVLIVPYGIETLYYKRKTRICEVLIVPYGIETCSALWTIPVNFVLIVPYGIETLLLNTFISILF